MRVHLTSKLCAEVWRTGYEFSLNHEYENSKLEMETPKFPAKIDFNFHWKSSSLQTETSDFGPDFLFSFLNGAQLMTTHNAIQLLCFLQQPLMKNMKLHCIAIR